MTKPTSLILLAAALMLAACAAPTPAPPTAVPTAPPTPVPPPTATPDPCAPENLQEAIIPVDRLMREFDDASLLAQNTPQELLLTPISDLQRIRREAEDQEIALCLLDLKSYQVAHMNSVIDVLIGFLKGADADLINQGSAQARQLHDQYTLELARLLGITLVPMASETPAEGTALPQATAAP